MSQQKTYEPAMCAWCAGTKKSAISLGHIVSCLVCGGKGHILVIQPAEQCQQCGGSGKRNVVNPCLTCVGTGWARTSGQEARSHGGFHRSDREK